MAKRPRRVISDDEEDDDLILVSSRPCKSTASIPTSSHSRPSPQNLPRTFHVSSSTDTAPDVYTGKTQLEHVIGVSRLSWDERDEELLEDKERRARELGEMSLEMHRQAHTACDCDPTMSYEVLNGVSSNISRLDDENIPLALTRVRNQLQLPLTQLGFMILAFSTVGGFLTNPFGIARFFADLADRPIYILIQESEAFSRLWRLSDILLTIYDVLKPESTLSIPGYDPHSFRLVRNLITSIISEGYSKVKWQRSQWEIRLNAFQKRRNVERIQSNDDGFTFAIHPSTRYSRLVRINGSIFQPRYNVMEEKRYPVYEKNGFKQCPHCAEMFQSIEAIVAHLMDIIYSSDQLQCPLCPGVYKEWNFVSIIEGIQHLCRHLTPAKHKVEQAAVKAQCPICLGGFKTIAICTGHIFDTHVRAFEMQFAATRVEISTVDSCAAKDAELNALLRARDSLRLAGLSHVFSHLEKHIGKDQMIWSISSHPSSSDCGLPNLPAIDIDWHATGNEETVVDSRALHSRNTKFEKAIYKIDTRGWIECCVTFCDCNEYFETFEAMLMHVHTMMWTCLKRREYALGVRLQRMQKWFLQLPTQRRRTSAGPEILGTCYDTFRHGSNAHTAQWITCISAERAEIFVTILEIHTRKSEPNRKGRRSRGS